MHAAVNKRYFVFFRMQYRFQCRAWLTKTIAFYKAPISKFYANVVSAVMFFRV